MLHPGSAKNVITGIRAELNQEAGIALADADEARQGQPVRENTAVMNKVGIALYSNTRYTIVRDNQVAGNDWDGIRLEMASDNTIENNEIANSMGFGVNIYGGSNNLVARTCLRATAAASGSARSSSRRTARASRATRSSTASARASSWWTPPTCRCCTTSSRDGGGPASSWSSRANAIVRGNDFSGNVGGIMLEETNDSIIEQNNAGGGLGTGIEIGELSGNNNILNNAASANGGEGIAISDAAPAGPATRSRATRPTATAATASPPRASGTRSAARPRARATRFS